MTDDRNDSKPFRATFISVEFRNGHIHTVKSHGSWNMWVGSEAGELENQIDYIFYLLCSVKIVSFIYVVCLVYYRG
jgi:hypothetical protein